MRRQVALPAAYVATIPHALELLNILLAQDTLRYSLFVLACKTLGPSRVFEDFLGTADHIRSERQRQIKHGLVIRARQCIIQTRAETARTNRPCGHGNKLGNIGHKVAESRRGEELVR